MTTANKITIFRVVLIPVFLVLAYAGLRYWAFAVFVLASLSDMLDGYIARHYNQITDIGKFMDPLADKMLTVSASAQVLKIYSLDAETSAHTTALLKSLAMRNRLPPSYFAGRAGRCGTHPAGSSSRA